MREDTISAISTSLGEGGIGIVRMSGPEAFDIAKKIFVRKGKGSPMENYKLHYGYIQDPGSDKIIDEVLVSFMPAPYTYTRGDVVEINCHGGIVPLKRILDLTLRQGARLADPGEFTFRAFMNGRIDLSQAEAVIDIIRAKTETAGEVAVSQIGGKLSQRIHQMKETIENILTLMEVNLDFPEEDIEETRQEQFQESIKTVTMELEEILETAEQGKIIREGIKTAIIGKPNVGKSSLLNALLKEQRAIVTEVPGTTRDLLEEVINIKGLPLKVIDTAGIRRTKDTVEKIGVELAEALISQSDLILFIIDARTGIQEEDWSIMEKIKGKRTIIIINKTDLVEEEVVEELKGQVMREPVISTSIKYGRGVKELEQEIANLFFEEGIDAAESILISNTRHKASLEKSREFLGEALKTLEEGLPVDLVTIDLKGAWEALGEITGESLDEKIIGKIFSQFCIGK